MRLLQPAAPVEETQQIHTSFESVPRAAARRVAAPTAGAWSLVHSCATDDRCNVDDSADAKRAAAGKMVKVQESCSLLMSTTATRVSFDPCKQNITKST